jgi:hypothetical protein
VEPIPFIDIDELAVDQEIVSSGNGASTNPLDGETQSVKPVNQFRSDSLLHIPREDSLPFPGVFDSGLLAHDPLILLNLRLAHREIVNKQARWPWQIGRHAYCPWLHAGLPTASQQQ